VAEAIAEGEGTAISKVSALTEPSARAGERSAAGPATIPANSAGHAVKESGNAAAEAGYAEAGYAEAGDATRKGG
jgi:hypothetical protein